MAKTHLDEPIKEGSIQVKLFRGPVDSLSLHEITDYELGLMEKGVVKTKMLQWAVVVLLASVLLTASSALTLLEFGLIYMLLVAVVIFAMCFAIFTLILWKKSNTRSKQLCTKIRSRIPVENLRKSDGRTQFPRIPLATNG